MKLVWGVDLGGTKIEGIVLNTSDTATPIARMRIETGAEKGYSHILAQIESLITELRKKTGEEPEVIGFGTPGTLDLETQSMKNCNTNCLNGMPLKADLESILGVKVVLANDANCFALAESKLGAAKGSSSVFGIIMGTGVGGGIVINNRLWSGFHGIAGEWGHNILIEEGEPCYCGKNGCVETVISGPALEKFYLTQSGAKRNLYEIMQRASSGNDPAATQTRQRLLSYFSKAVSVVINIFDPETVIIGGGVSNVNILYDEAPREVARFIFNNRMNCKIIKHSLGDSAGVFGAALLIDAL